MPQITTRGAVRFARFEYKNTVAQSIATFPTNYSSSTLGTAVPHIAEFPSIGAEPSITNVNEYGSLTSFQIATQADSAALTFGLNYNPTAHAATEALVGNGNLYLMGIALSDSASDANLTAVYWYGKFEAFSFTPANNGVMTASLTVSRHSDFSAKVTTSS